MTDRLTPYADRDSAPWWAALARHELVHQRCDACGRWRWPPRAMCGECGSFDWSWQPVSGTGVVVSWIRTHHAFLPGFQAPYHTVFIQIDESDDIVMPGTWFGEVPPRTGMRVRAHFDDVEQRHSDDIEQQDSENRVTLLGWTTQED